VSLPHLILKLGGKPRKLTKVCGLQNRKGRFAVGASGLCGHLGEVGLHADLLKDPLHVLAGLICWQRGPTSGNDIAGLPRCGTLLLPTVGTGGVCTRRGFAGKTGPVMDRYLIQPPVKIAHARGELSPECPLGRFPGLCLTGQLVSQSTVLRDPGEGLLLQTLTHICKFAPNAVHTIFHLAELRVSALASCADTLDSFT
jgi:hypothetical protein